MSFDYASCGSRYRQTVKITYLKRLHTATHSSTTASLKPKLVLCLVYSTAVLCCYGCMCSIGGYETFDPSYLLTYLVMQLVSQKKYVLLHVVVFYFSEVQIMH